MTDDDSVNESQTMVKLRKLYDSMVQKTATLVAPDSLVHVPEDLPYTKREWSHTVNRSHNKNEALKQSLKRLRPGDIILTKTPGMFYRAARTAANSTYDHCVVVANQAGMVIHVGPPKVRMIRVERIVKPEWCPCVFRSRLSPKQKKKFVQLLERNTGKRYAAFAAYKTLATLSVEHITGITLSSSGGSSEKKSLNKKRSMMGQSHIVCTDTILTALCRVSKAFTNAVHSCEPPLDCVRHQRGAASLEDVLRLHRYRPDLLIRIPLVQSLFPDGAFLQPPTTTSTIKVLNQLGRTVYGHANSLTSMMNDQLEEQLRKPKMQVATDALVKAGVVTRKKKKQNKMPVMVARDPVMHEISGVVTTASTRPVTYGDDAAVEMNDNTKSYQQLTEDSDGGSGDNSTEETELIIHWGKMQAVLATTAGVFVWTKRKKIMNRIMMTALLLYAARFGVLKMKNTLANDKDKKQLRSRL